MAENSLQIILADDHEILRFGLRGLLEKEAGLEVVGEAANGQELLKLLAERPCRIVLLDLTMPELDGLNALDIMRERYPQTIPVVLTMHSEREFLRMALDRGAGGYILKSDDLSRIPRALKEIAAGKAYVSPELSGMLFEDLREARNSSTHLHLLTRREREVLKLIVAGKTNNQIGDELDISPRTVQTHRSSMMEKLDLKNVAELVKFAVANSLG